MRIRRAWYGVPETPYEYRAAIAMGGRVGGLSAARSYGLWDPGDRDIHVSWPPHGNVARLGRRLGYPANADIGEGRIVSHWRILRETEPPRELWRESAEQTIAQVLLSSDRSTAVAVVDSALHIGVIAPHQLHFIFGRMPARVRALRAAIDGGADSGLESIVRLWLWDQGLPFLAHATAADLEVDLLVGTSLVIELDGERFHATPEAFESDRRRDTVLGSAGYIVIRFSYQQITEDWESCAARIRHHLSRGDHLRRI